MIGLDLNKKKKQKNCILNFNSIVFLCFRRLVVNDPANSNDFDIKHRILTFVF